MGIKRRTKSVKKLLGAFEATSGAISALDLVSQFKEDMNKTTVYRALERLEDEGILHSFTGQEGLRMYAKCHGCSSAKHTDLHPHFQCSDCGKTECLSMEIQIPRLQNKRIDAANFLIMGLCESCLG